MSPLLRLVDTMVKLKLRLEVRLASVRRVSLSAGYISKGVDK
jgi:hypothetical protein